MLNGCLEVIVKTEKRREKILTVIRKLRNRPLIDLEKMYKEMKLTLIHNQKVNDDFQNRKNRAGWSFVHEYEDIAYGKHEINKGKRVL